MQANKPLGWLLCLAFAGGAWADVAPLDHEAYEAEHQRIEAQRKTDDLACKRLPREARDLCAAQAKGREQTALADLEVLREPTPEAEREAKFARAEAEYRIAKVRCRTLEGKKKRATCLDQAQAARVAAERLAKVEKVDSINERKAKAARKPT